MEGQNKIKLSDILGYIDLLQIPISLSFKKNYYYRSSFGGIITIIDIILISTFSIITIKDIYKKSNFSISSTETNDLSALIDFSNKPLGFQLIDAKGNPINYDLQLYEYKIIETEYYSLNINYENKYIKYSEKEIEYEKCENLIGKNKLHNYFKDYNISNMFCIKPNQNISVYGKSDDILNGFKDIKLYINKYNNSSHGIIDIDFINEMLSNVKMNIVFLGYEIDFSKNTDDDIVKYKLYSKSYSFSNNFIKKYFNYFEKANYIYYNLFSSIKKTIPFYIYDGFDYDLEDISPYNNTFGIIVFSSSGSLIEYIKKTESITDAISKISGMFNLIVILSQILNNFVSKRILFLDMYDYIYFEQEKNNNTNINNINNEIIHAKINNINKTNNNVSGIKTNFNERKNFMAFQSNSQSYPKLFDNSKNLIFSKNSSFNKSNNNIENNNNEYNDIENIINYNNNENNNFSHFKKDKKSLKIRFKSLNILTRLEVERTFIGERKKISSKNIIFYYFCPLFLMKRSSKLECFYNLDKDICKCFSIEHFFKLIIFQNSFETIINKKDNSMMN